METDASGKVRPEEREPAPAAKGPTRRKVVGIAVAGVAGAAAGVAAPGLLGRYGHRDRPAWRFFTPEEARLVIALCEQIIPADQDAGATQAGVVFFIDRQLAGHYRGLQFYYRRGLAGVRATSREMHGKPFEELTSEQQIALLQAMEANKVNKAHWNDPTAAGFFDMLVRHTMQGYYGSPRHGGNRDYASYRMLGLEYPRVIGRNRPTA